MIPFTQAFLHMIWYTGRQGTGEEMTEKKKPQSIFMPETDQNPSDFSMEPGCCSIRTTHREETEKKALISRCNRVEGQIRGVRGMLERDAYCDDVLNQIQAARAALDAISRLVLEHHMKSCLIDRVRAGEDEVVDELLVTLQKLMR